MTSELPPLPDTPPPAPTEPPAVSAHVPPAPAARRLSPLAAGLIGLATGAAIVGGTWAITANSGPDAPATFTLKGSFALTDSVVPDGNGGCGGTRGYDDILEGAGVTVYGASGDVIATGGLGNSTYDGDTYDCTFKVAVPDVPKGERFYKVEVSHRGTVQLSGKEAENGDFGASLG
ncbi:hypothetical protein [Streptomyces avermitilis]|uniref:Uncharacterized protein n=1 Tax=Streptomyces avermitilis TaxID=33903 RepID=A0A4D4LMB6_STRAX|nr:hypothetical protein [Streptomyces avermitilis]BBJ49583.1 hypothetical protein SAVMC3_22120 [Streptomyces avermitilis]GDY61604.1 hypothetical protein SAV14893_009970 [Streptomyces avermitilis]GDY78290.1 hypothetical protein SAV31267_077750 [Streptomyces avermitilis]GDY87145.1 hypothetical protein SAVCW2_63440 [Streptomyces avermitilis]